MLRRLLHLVIAQDTVDIARIAQTLGVSPRQARHAIEDLERLGYLDEVAPCGGELCGHCPLRSVCRSDCRPRLWRLTRAGERASSAFGRKV